MVCPVPIQWVHLFLLLLLVELVEHSCKTGIIGGQVHRSHPIAIFDRVRSSMQNQSLSDVLVPQLCSIMQRSVEIIVALIKANPRAEQQQTVFQLVGLAGNMEGGLAEISQGVDVDSGVVDQTAEDLDGTFHGRVVQGCPVGLVTVVYVDHNATVLAVEDVGEIFRLVLDNGLQKLLV